MEDVANRPGRCVLLASEHLDTKTNDERTCKACEEHKQRNANAPLFHAVTFGFVAVFLLTRLATDFGVGARSPVIGSKPIDLTTASNTGVPACTSALFVSARLTLLRTGISLSLSLGWLGRTSHKIDTI